MFSLKITRWLAALLFIALTFGLASVGEAAPSKPPTAEKKPAAKKPAPSAKKAPAKKKPAAKKPAPKPTGITAELAKLKIRPSKIGNTLYFEIGPTQVQKKVGRRNPPRMQNWWSVHVAWRKEPGPDGIIDADVRGLLDLAKAMKEHPNRTGGGIYAFIDPVDPGATEALAIRVARTQRTITGVSCVALGQVARVDCNGTFAKWGMPKIIGYKPVP